MLLRRQADEDRDEHIDMTPMVDVVFQLMTFMLFTMQLSGGEKVDVPAARHGVGVADEDAIIVTLPKQAAGKDQAPEVILGDAVGKRTSSMDEMKNYINDGLKQGRKKVVLMADGGVPHGAVVKVAAGVTDVENVTLHIAVQEPQ